MPSLLRRSIFGIPLTHLIIIATITIAEALTHFGVVYSDSKYYFYLTRFFQGLRGYPHPGIVTRPILPLLTAPFGFIFWLPVSYGIVNTVFWFLSSMLMYKLTQEIIRSNEISLYSSLLMTTSWPMVLYGATVMTESTGLFFTLLICYFGFKLVKSSPLSKPKYALYGIMLGVGTLSREVVWVAVAFVFLYSIYRKSFTKIAPFLFFLLLVPLSWSIYVNLSYNNSATEYYLGYIRSLSHKGAYVVFNLWHHLINVSKAMLLGHFPLASLALIIGFLWETRREVLIDVYSLAIPAFLLFTTLSWIDLRYAVLLYQATMPVAGIGLKVLGEQLSSKPVLKLLPLRAWIVILFSFQLIIVNWVTFVKWKTISFPWEIYLFAPSSLNPPWF